LTLSQLILVLCAAALHASWNVAAKYGSGAGYIFAFAYKLIATLFYLPIVVFLLFHQQTTFSFFILFILVLTAVIHLLYSLSLLTGYQRAGISVVYPVARGTGPLITSVLAFLVFNERLNWVEVLGILSICGGVLFIALKDKLTQTSQEGSSWLGVRWGLFIGLIIASYSIVDAYAVKVLALTPVLVNWVSSLGGTCLLLPKVLKERKKLGPSMKGIWKYAAFIGVVSPLAYILVLFAIQTGANVSIVAPLRETSMVFATLAGIWLFKEKMPLISWLGCLSILLGVVLVAS